MSEPPQCEASSADPLFMGFVVLLVIVFVFSLGWIVGSSHEHRKASEAGVGRFVIDQKTGETLFRYGREGASR